MTKNENPKALNLDDLVTVQNKVTLGFKCLPKLKLHLAQQAQSVGITLSEFVESIVSNYEHAVDQVIKKQKEKIDFYENDLLQKLYNENKGQTIEFISTKGEKMKIKIEQLQNIYTVLIHSFKTKSK